MRFEKHEVRITDHGYDQYCARVEPINRKILTETCQQQLIKKDYTRQKGDFLHLGGVWWVYVFENDSVLCFITCYGRTEIDLPKALSWAALHDDKIVLTKLPGVTL